MGDGKGPGLWFLLLAAKLPLDSGQGPPSFDELGIFDASIDSGSSRGLGAGEGDLSLRPIGSARCARDPFFMAFALILVASMGRGEG